MDILKDVFVDANKESASRQAESCTVCWRGTRGRELKWCKRGRDSTRTAAEKHWEEYSGCFSICLGPNCILLVFLFVFPELSRLGRPRSSRHF